MKLRIGIMVLPRFDMNNAIGGAENICRIVSIGLSEIADVIVFHAEDNPQNKLGTVSRHTEKLSSINAFYIDDWSKNRGEISPAFCTNAWKKLLRCDLLISFERVLKQSPIPQMVVLGGISYTHCVDIAISSDFDKLIVPSSFIKEKCVAFGADVNKIHVVPNGIDCKRFHRFQKGKTFKALLPFRPDEGKGFIESIDFIQKINSYGRWGKYKILITRQFDNIFSKENFYNKIEDYALKKGVTIEYISWSNQDSMNYIYNQCDFVLSLGNLEEGFGLTTIESILSGHPVLSKRIGATKDIMPPNTGIVFYDKELNEENIIQKLMNTTDDEIAKGCSYIKENYTIEKMQANYLKLVKNFLLLRRNKK